MLTVISAIVDAVNSRLTLFKTELQLNHECSVHASLRRVLAALSTAPRVQNVPDTDPRGSLLSLYQIGFVFLPPRRLRLGRHQKNAWRPVRMFVRPECARSQVTQSLIAGCNVEIFSDGPDSEASATNHQISTSTKRVVMHWTFVNASQCETDVFDVVQERDNSPCIIIGQDIIDPGASVNKLETVRVSSELLPSKEWRLQNSQAARLEFSHDDGCSPPISRRLTPSLPGTTHGAKSQPDNYQPSSTFHTHEAARSHEWSRRMTHETHLDSAYTRRATHETRHDEDLSRAPVRKVRPDRPSIQRVYETRQDEDFARAPVRKVRLDRPSIKRVHELRPKRSDEVLRPEH